MTGEAPDAASANPTTGERRARPDRPPGMMDVARLAGVSHQTVSRVLNGHPSVRDSTRARVLASIKALDYRRNLAARALVTGRSHALGVVSFDTNLYGPASTLYGIEHAARDAGYFVTIASLERIDRASVLEALGRLMSQSVSGIIVIAPQVTASSALAGLPASVPVVAVGGGEVAGIPTVGVDQEHGAALATQHLLDHGHETVWHVAGPLDWMEATSRLTAWRRTLTQAGVGVPRPLPGDWSAKSGYAAGRVLAKTRDVTAVFAANDHMALGVLRAFTEAGIRVPDDVSLVGFDDVPEAEFFSPPLTTIRQDFDELGRKSLGLLLGLITEPASHGEHARVPAQLIERMSVAVPVG